MKKEGKRLKKKTSSKTAFEDKRFTHVKSDPKFANIKVADRKIVIEKRFSGLLTDEKFADSSTVDKRGKPIRRKKNNLSSLYSVELDEEEEKDLDLKEGEGEKKKKKKKKIVAVEKTEESDESGNDVDGNDSVDEEDDDETDDDDEPMIKIDLARGEGNVSSSDDEESSDESEWEVPDEVEQQMNIALLDSNCEQVEWASKRLAACNLDWDIVKAEDIYILVNSFVPAGGEVVNVRIYLSDFGKEKLEIEDNFGPRLDVEAKEDEELDDKDMKVLCAVRKYNIEKLKYYYAIIECDSEASATRIYENCDGVLFENTGLKMDLRFVPDDMDFDEDRLKEQLEKNDINVTKYKPKTSMKATATTMTGDVKWDDEDYERKQLVQEAFNDDFGRNKMLADSDSEDETAVENRRNALLSLISVEPKAEKLKIEWDDDEKDASDSDDSDIEKALAKRGQENDTSDDESHTEALKTEKASPKKNGYKAYLEKAKERRKEKKLRMRQAHSGGFVAQELGEPEKKKRAQTRADLKSSDYGTAAAVLADDRFNALVTDSAFTIEQTSKHSKGSKLIELQVQAKKHSAPVAKKEESLVDSLKSKSAKWNVKKRK